jgi:hypothetical protein
MVLSEAEKTVGACRPPFSGRQVVALDIIGVDAFAAAEVRKRAALLPWPVVPSV